MMRCTHVIILILTLLHGAYLLSAQDAEKYVFKTTYNSASTYLMDKLRYQINSEMADGLSDGSSEVKRINDQRIRYLKSLVDDEMLINDVKFESTLDRIVKRIANASGLSERPRYVLIIKTPDVNAINFGKGIYMITLGLMARVNNEDQLAFALAHEMAHDELNHVRSNVLKNAGTDEQKRTAKSLNRIVQGRSEENELEAVKRTIYSANKFHRAKELEADSLGIMYFTKAGYDPARGKELFNILKDPTSMKEDIGIELLLPLHSDEYPIQEHWLHDRLSVYSKEIAAPLGFSLDSLKSHPDIEVRKERFRFYKTHTPIGTFKKDPEFPAVCLEAELELLAFLNSKKSLDRGLFLALQLLRSDPGNEYLVLIIGRIFLGLKNARDLLTFDQYVPKYTIGYSEDLKLLNNMLQNMSTKELAELGYHFISNEKHFNENNRSHVYLKGKLAAATYRYDEEKKMKKLYREKSHGSANGNGNR